MVPSPAVHDAARVSTAAQHGDVFGGTTRRHAPLFDGVMRRSRFAESGRGRRPGVLVGSATDSQESASTAAAAASDDGAKLTRQVRRVRRSDGNKVISYVCTRVELAPT